jgi:thiol-disulfide isomerase/thioredoxin
MGTLLILGRLFLAAVFGSAGVSKLAAARSTRAAMQEFGMPAALAAPAAGVLICAELVTASALAVPASVYYGAAAAFALSCLFSGVLGFNLLHKRHPSCNCFGQLQAKPISWGTVVRAAILGAVALLILSYARDGHIGEAAWLSDLSARDWIVGVVDLALLAFLALTAALLWQVLRQQGRMLLRLEAVEERLGLRPTESTPVHEGLAPDTPAPGFTLTDLQGATKTLSHLLEAKRPALLIFTNPACGPCQALLPELAQWQRQLRDSLTIAVISEGSVSQSADYAAVLDPERVLIQRGREVSDAYQARGTPVALAVTADGRVATHLAQGPEEIRALVGAMLAGRIPLLVPSGMLATQFSLTSTEGKIVTQEDLRGEPTLLLFWNPNCGFCQRMLSGLKAWVGARRVDAPRLLVISSGSAEDHRDWDALATVALDPDGRVAGSFGAHGTPMSILVDAEGHIASELAAGAQAFFNLAGRGSQAPGSAKARAG